MMSNAQNIAVKYIISTKLFLPLLQNCPSKYVQDLFCHVSNDSLLDIRRIVDMLTRGTAHLYNKTIAYTILGVMYDRCSIDYIREVLTKRFVGHIKESTGKELTQAIIKAANHLLANCSPGSQPPRQKGHQKLASPNH